MFSRFIGGNSPLQLRHNERDGVSNHQPRDCLLNRLFKAQIKENIKAPRYWPLCGNSPVTGEFPAQRASNAENVSIWWRHHDSARNWVPGTLGFECWPRRRKSKCLLSILNHYPVALYNSNFKKSFKKKGISKAESPCQIFVRSHIIVQTFCIKGIHDAQVK